MGACLRREFALVDACPGRGWACVWPEPTERTCARMGYLEGVRAWLEANKPEVQEPLRRARRDVLAMIEGQPPQEGADYGPWKPQMQELSLAFFLDEGRRVQHDLARMLHKEVAEERVLLRGAVASDDRPWVEVLEELWEKIEAEERRAAAERRMRERLARTTGVSMADKILAMLRKQDLSRTDIYRRYSRNVSAERINDALFVLERLGWARWKMVSTGGRGREVWFLPPDEE